jgi:hypothetical protein
MGRVRQVCWGTRPDCELAPALTHTPPPIVGETYQDLSAYSTITLPVIFG